MAKSTRQNRKVEHIRCSLALEDGPGTSGFEDIQLVHNCLPELSVGEINLSTSLCGLSLPVPIIINALTGGASDTQEINRMLAQVARTTGVAMAVGSQMAALEETGLSETFRVVRKENPQGIIIANIGAYVSPALAWQAVEMVRANALQVHLNVTQELMMPEGDRDFRGYAANIRAIVQAVDVPVIAKEVGFGIAREQAAELTALGIRGLDVGGKGGTNFVAVETMRGKNAASVFMDWGLSTAVSLVETRASCAGDVSVVASGGIRTALDIAKALSLGADAVGIAGPFLKILEGEGPAALSVFIRQLISDLTVVMVLVGARDLAALRRVPVVITGRTAEYLTRRGIDVNAFACRAIIK